MPSESTAAASLGAPIDAGDDPRRNAQSARGARSRRDTRALGAVALLAGATVAVARSGSWSAGSDVGYALGLAGGIAMLLLFLYPLRKRLRFAQRIGHLRAFFAVHMALGIAGPLLIVLHSRLEFGSLNATVAFTSMALVAGSGIIGRFLYSRIHHGLYGEKATLAQLRQQASEGAEAMHGLAAIAPEIVERLDRYAAHAEQVGRRGLARPIAFFLLGFAGIRERRLGIRIVRRALEQFARKEGWDDARLARRTERRRALIVAYIATVQRLAQFAVFERLFSWWHVLHVPLVWLLVATVIAHVVAVHMY